MKHTDFGADANGKPYTIELGANWITGPGNNTGVENPVWSFAKQVNLAVGDQYYESMLSYDAKGANNYTDQVVDFTDNFYPILDQDAGIILQNNYQTKSARAGLLYNGWRSLGDPIRKAIEWFQWDFYFAMAPEETDYVWGIVNSNATFNGFSDQDFLCVDQRGFNTWLKNEAAKFLKPNDTRLLLNTIVTNITYTDSGVTILNQDGSCVEADYAITTVSLGVLQNDVITFEPDLPEWKISGITTFAMATYTKLFFQWDEAWWPQDKQFFIYADPAQRGYYTLWQSLSVDGFLPGSNILFATLTGQQAYRAEGQDDETTKAEGMAVLRSMFPDINIPEPSAFTYPRWTTNPWTYGSYSNWPVGTTLEMHEDLRANVGRLYFAGEHTSSEYFGYLHGAWFEGREAGERIAGKITGECRNAIGGCGDYTIHDALYGTTDFSDVNASNGVFASPFYVAPVINGTD